MSSTENPQRAQTANESLGSAKSVGFYTAIADSAKERLEYLRQKELEQAKKGQDSGK